MPVKQNPFIWTALLLLFCACSAPTREIAFPLEEMAPGDLAFRCGRGVFSRAVTVAEEDGVYSHVGILVQDGGQWKVVHAVPGEREFKGDYDRVKMENLEVFFAPDRALRGCLVHTGLRDSTLVESLCREAIQNARDSVRFDNDYNLQDSSQVYCTEFVWRLYLKRGMDLTEGRRRFIRALQINGDVILPEHLLDYSNNFVYLCF